MPKKVLIFSLAYFPKFVGGAEVAVKEITERISDIEWHMVTLRFDRAAPDIEKIGNVTVHRVGSRGSYLSKMIFLPLAALKARRLHREKSFDAAWAMMSYMLLPLIFARLRLPYVLTLQEGDTEHHMFGRLRILPFLPFINYGFRHASIVQAISTYLGTWARRRGFKGPLEIIPNGVDVPRFSETYPPRVIDEVKDELGKRMGDVFLVTTSRLVHKNALDVCLTALTMLPEHVRFVVIGTGPLESDLKLKTRNLKLESRVQFIGHIGHEELPKYLKACDIFVRPSRSEGMGNSFIEAMAAGLPVVATQEGGIADFLFDEKRNPDREITGFAVDKDSSEEIALQVKNIMEHPEKTRAVVATARAMVLEKYDWDILAKDMREKVFGRVIKTS
ncbi:glycosyltransferase family 1 protein [Candidatus Parcubacteria bacterium]|nr:MAG: glycosyltransferase family 1 protein [Candidatus Parcubacteria bacterium]